MELSNFITANKNKILNIAVLVFALLLAQKIYKVQDKTIQALKENQMQEIKKNEILSDISHLEKKIKSYKDFFNQKNASLAINTLNTIARESAVEIISLSPQPEERHPLYVEYPFRLSVSADNYHLLGKFISKVESHAHAYIVKEATVKKVEEVGEGLRSEKIVMDLTIGIPLFKD